MKQFYPTPAAGDQADNEREFAPPHSAGSSIFSGAKVINATPKSEVDPDATPDRDATPLAHHYDMATPEALSIHQAPKQRRSTRGRPSGGFVQPA